jgi:hypothetical protein
MAAFLDSIGPLPIIDFEDNVKEESSGDTTKTSQKSVSKVLADGTYATETIFSTLPATKADKDSKTCLKSKR